MKVVHKDFRVSTKSRNQMIDITSDVQRIVDDLNIQNGHVIVYIPHTTAGVTINEGADPSVQRDIVETLRRIVPESGDYHHMEGNSDAHIKASLLGSSVMIPVSDGRLLLGTWQHIFFFEGDGPRRRRAQIQCLSKNMVKS